VPPSPFLLKGDVSTLRGETHDRAAGRFAGAARRSGSRCSSRAVSTDSRRETTCSSRAPLDEQNPPMTPQTPRLSVRPPGRASGGRRPTNSRWSVEPGQAASVRAAVTATAVYPIVKLPPTASIAAPMPASSPSTLPALYPAAAAGLPTLADPGYDGAGIGIHIPVRQPADGRELDTDARTATRCSARCAASANAGSPCSPAAGAPCSTSPPAPARSAISPVQPWSSLISSTATSNENR
jgi:hypothetical protein